MRALDCGILQEVTSSDIASRVLDALLHLFKRARRSYPRSIIALFPKCGSF